MAKITAELTTGTVVRMSNGRHTWSADEPLDKGGTDAGPTPYELLLGSLAACTCITLALYARHKGIALQTVRTSYTYKRVHADDCEKWADTKTGFIDHVTTNVEIAGDFDEAQRRRLAQVATRCPVHKTFRERRGLFRQRELRLRPGRGNEDESCRVSLQHWRHRVYGRAWRRIHGQRQLSVYQCAPGHLSRRAARPRPSGPNHGAHNESVDQHRRAISGV